MLFVKALTERNDLIVIMNIRSLILTFTQLIGSNDVDEDEEGIVLTAA